MTQILLVLSAVLTIGGLVPYLKDIVHRRTKPRIVSWFNWSLLTGIASAASLAEQQYASAILTTAATVATALVVILGLKYSSDRKFETFDVVCQFGAVSGLVLWIVFSSPLVALLAALTIDFVVGLPTWKHAWQEPYEETTSAFICGSLGGLCSLLAAISGNGLELAGLIFPVYLTINNGSIAALIRFSPNRFHESNI